MERILITGVSGQIGSYLAEMLVAEGHEVLGVSAATEALPEGVTRARGSLSPNDVAELVNGNGPLTAIVHLASMTSMTQTWEAPVRTFDENARPAVALVFAAVKSPGLRLVHASSAEIFGRAKSPVQNESTPIDPVSPYGIAKAAAHMTIRLGRSNYGAPMSNLIFYLGESPRRRPTFVFRKICSQVAAIAEGKAQYLTLGNTAAIRDFSHARDLAGAARLMALGATPGDYICSSGEGHSILDLAATACRMKGIDPAKVIRTDPALLRPNDIPSLVGDNSALRSLGWKPSVTFRELVAEVVAHDSANVEAGKIPT